MSKNRPLELLERGARIDPELVDERPARVLVGLQGLRLPARPVQRRHQVAAQTLAQRVLGDERLELPDQLVVAPEGEVGVDAELDRRQLHLLQPGDCGLGEALVGEVRQRRGPSTARARRGAAPPRRPRGRA